MSHVVGKPADAWLGLRVALYCDWSQPTHVRGVPLYTPFLWHAAHRIAILLHDFGVHAVAAVKLLSYGGALLGTVIAGYALLAVGS